MSLLFAMQKEGKRVQLGLKSRRKNRPTRYSPKHPGRNLHLDDTPHLEQSIPLPSPPSTIIPLPCSQTPQILRYQDLQGNDGLGIGQKLELIPSKGSGENDVGNDEFVRVRSLAGWAVRWRGREKESTGDG